MMSPYSPPQGVSAGFSSQDHLTSTLKDWGAAGSAPHFHIGPRPPIYSGSEQASKHSV